MASASMRFGFPLEQWEAGRDEVEKVLIRRAKVGKTIAYSDLAREVSTISLQPDSYAFGAMLGEISEAQDALGRGMLSVLVVHQDGDMRPGHGFFDLAKRLGRDTSDKERCWIDEFTHVTRVWRRS